METKTERLNLRLTRAQDTTLRRAAEAKGVPVSDYVLGHAVQAAEADLADRRVFVVDEEAWALLKDCLLYTSHPLGEDGRHQVLAGREAPVEGGVARPGPVGYLI